MTRACPRTIAFYLPQFHPIPENDAWWGSGFTEWRNVTRGRAMFEGHLQPRRPADLGYYDLRLPEVQQAQADLASSYGIHGFCYYHYWFAGTRLLERPLDTVLSSGHPTLPFCVCWANENWTRRWDGLEDEILIGQQHSPEIDRRFILDLLPTLGDDRYITVDGKRLLMVYRPTKLFNCLRATDTWRDEVLKAGLGELHLVMVQHGDDDPASLGFDAAVEFPPHGLTVPDIQNTVGNLDPEFRGGIYDYDALATAASERGRPHHPMHRGVMLGWDNTARRGSQATIYHGATPNRYRRWLESMLNDAIEHGGPDEVVFINAWNEWAEGTYLEPDEHNGHAWLEATKAAIESVGGETGRIASRPVIAVDSDPTPRDIARLSRNRKRARNRQQLNTLRIRAGNFMKRPGKLAKLRKHGSGAMHAVRRRIPLTSRQTGPSMEPLWRPAPGDRKGKGRPILFVGHDAHLAGSQMLLLEMFRLSRDAPNMYPMTLLLDGGPLETEYQKLVTTCSIRPMLEAGIDLDSAIRSAMEAAPVKPDVVVCSTVATAAAARVCRALDVPVIHLINELPTTVESNGWENLVLDIGISARRMVFVSDFSRKAFIDRFDLDHDRCEVVHPGWLGSTTTSSEKMRTRKKVRKELELPDDALIVFGCGQIHPRKGVDLFIQTAANILGRTRRSHVHFVWIGDGTPEHRRWVDHDLASLPCKENIHVLTSRSDIQPFFDAADVYVLSSREDPYPIVCVQAMAADLPVVAFDRIGGAPEAIMEGMGFVVPFLDIEKMADSVDLLIDDDGRRSAMGQAAGEHARASCSSRHHFEGIMDIVARTCGIDMGR